MIEECIKRFDAMIYLSEEEYSKALRIMPDRMKRNIGIYGMIKLSIKAKIPMAMKILRRIRYYKGLTHN